MALVESQRTERVQPRRSERRQVHRAGQRGHEKGEWCPEGLPREAEISGGALAFQAVQSGCPSGTSDHVWALVPAAGSSVGLEGSKPGAGGRPRPAPAIKGRSRLQRPLMRRGRLLEPESQTPCQYSQGGGTVTDCGRKVLRGSAGGAGVKSRGPGPAEPSYSM